MAPYKKHAAELYFAYRFGVAYVDYQTYVQIVFAQGIFLRPISYLPDIAFGRGLAL